MRLKTIKYLHYLPAIFLFLLAVVYCTVVYWSGNTESISVGNRFLTGIPNFYLFYLIILPFISAGITHLATRNANIRFFGDVGDALELEQKLKVIRFRKILFVLASVFSLLITIEDAKNKDHPIPPYSLSFNSAQDYEQAVVVYSRLKGWFDYNEQQTLAGDSKQKLYLQKIKDLGFKNNRTTGFDSFSTWYSQSSCIYKLESFLSFIATFLICLFFAQLFLLMIVKSTALSETKYLVLWLIILCTFWFPTKIFSVWYYSFGAFSLPIIFWFGFLIFGIALALALFIKVDSSDISKYASAVAAVISFIATYISFSEPSWIMAALNLALRFGWIYGSILLMVLAFSLFLVTDHLIESYEKEKSNIHK